MWTCGYPCRASWVQGPGRSEGEEGAFTPLSVASNECCALGVFINLTAYIYIYNK